MSEMTKKPSSPYGWDFINDLSAVNEDEESIIEFLLHRLARGEIYTWVGPLLLAVNPGKHIIRDLYDESQCKAFRGDENGILQKPSPHIFAVASRAQYRLIHGLGKVCQVIVISGESGTGKTFNARKALDFLASSNVNLSGSGNSLCRIVNKIGNVFPLLSAFSTASTENNERSSRHGQLLRLQYDKNGVIRGACIRSFLLERTRITAGSNNFEIFYQFIAGLSDREIHELRLKRQGNYAMLGDFYQSEKEPRFYQGFQDTVKAFEALGFTGESKMDVFRVIALLMHLGNIKFRHKHGEGCAIDLEDEESRKALSNACSLILLPEEELSDLLTSILICPNNSKRRHTSYRRELKTVEDCRNRLFSIARYLYERLFQWIVACVNESLTANGENYDWLGILDIFGFESFELNGLEQLSINYTTERLQLHFMEDYLEAGQRELEEEGLEVLPPSFAIQVYRERLSAIETIVFATFNDACQSPIPPCSSSLRQQFLSKEKQASRFFKIKNDEFVIKHYSCAVTYNVDNLLAKNTDKVPTELSCTFARCNNKLLHVLSEVEEENVYGIAGRVSLKKCTALAKLKQSLDCLVKELNKCDSHYVRCTRPRHVDGSWVKNEFREQLACTGILDALPLAKCKFPIKFTYEEFYKRYSIKRGERDSDFIANLSTIINSLNIESSIHLGKRLLFVTENLFFALEKYRKNHRAKCAEKIQSFWLKTRQNRKAKTHKIVVDIESPDEEIFDIDITEPSQASSEQEIIFTKKLQSVNDNLKNTLSSVIEEIDEQLENISQVSVVVTKASQSSIEEDDVFTEVVQSDQENRENTSISGLEEIDEQMKDIYRASVIVPNPLKSSSEEDDILNEKWQSLEENLSNTSSTIIAEIDEQLEEVSRASGIVPNPIKSSSEEDDILNIKLQSDEENLMNTSSTIQYKEISRAPVIVTNPFKSSSEKDDVLDQRLQSVEDHENNNDEIDIEHRQDEEEADSKMKTVKISENIAVPSADTGYCSMGEKCSLGKIGSQFSHEEFQVAGKPLESSGDFFKTVDNIDYFKPVSEIDNWKEFYLRNWLESTSSDSEEDAPMLHTEIPHRFDRKYSRCRILDEDSTLKLQLNQLELFYRNRILSRRRPVEIPIKFHTRSTCLPGSHILPRWMGPRGLEDCLIEDLVSIKYIGCKNQ